jgi:hypothetical protein
VGIIAVGIPDEARTAPPRTRLRASTRLRRSKLVAAFAFTALVGVGSYAATYHALVVVSAPATATGSIAPASSDTGLTVPPAAPAPAHP